MEEKFLEDLEHFFKNLTDRRKILWMLKEIIFFFDRSSAQARQCYSTNLINI